MSVPGLLIALILSGVALAIVAGPLLRPPRGEEVAEEPLRRQRVRIHAYYERVLTNIRDLDEDFATGKINEGDYREEREVWAQRGIRLLRAADQLALEGSPMADAAEAEGIDRAIEEAVAAYRVGMRAAQGESTAGDETG